MNFSGFPLYSTLLKEIDNDSIITLTEKQYIMNNIKKIDKQNYEYLYCLIISYFIDNNKKNTKDIPYEGKQLKTGIKFNLEDLPKKLQKIIFIFMQKIIIAQEETQKIKCDNKEKKNKKSLKKN